MIRPLESFYATAYVVDEGPATVIWLLRAVVSQKDSNLCQLILCRFSSGPEVKEQRPEYGGGL